MKKLLLALLVFSFGSAAFACEGNWSGGLQASTRASSNGTSGSGPTAEQ